MGSMLSIALSVSSYSEMRMMNKNEQKVNIEIIESEKISLLTKIKKRFKKRNYLME